MTEPKPANDGDDDGTAYFRPAGSTRAGSGTGSSGPVQRDFERGLSLDRLTVVLPVVVLVLSGVGAYVYGTAIAVHSVEDIAHHRRPLPLRAVRGPDRPRDRSPPDSRLSCE